jgi:hypothetical protein
VKYVKNNGLKGREESSIDDARRELTRWVREIAGMRRHGTTGAKPLEVFEQLEAAALAPLPAVPYALIVWKKATVHSDTHVAFDRRLYSVPWRLIGQEVWIRATRSTVVILADDVPVALHDRKGPGPRSTIEEHLPEYRRDLRHRSRSYWEQRADAMGEEVGAYIREVFNTDDVLSQLRAVQAIVTHLETFPLRRAQAACARARHFGNHSYQAMKNILRRGLDLEPLSTTPAAPILSTPRFARKVTDLLPFGEGVNDEPN